MAGTVISAKYPPLIDPSRTTLAYGNRALPRLVSHLILTLDSLILYFIVVRYTGLSTVIVVWNFGLSLGILSSLNLSCNYCQKIQVLFAEVNHHCKN